MRFCVKTAGRADLIRTTADSLPMPKVKTKKTRKSKVKIS